MELHIFLIAVGGLLLAGLVADEVGRRTRLPRVTLLILFGVAVGPSGLNFLPEGHEQWYEFLASIALTMVAFLLGGTLSIQKLQKHGKGILLISAFAVFTTAFLVGGGLMLIGLSSALALLLAGIATATDPAATRDVVRQLRARGPFTDTLLGIVAVDDAWGLVAFSLLLIAAQAITGNGGGHILGHSLWELSGALVVGAGLGLPAAYLTGRLSPGEPMQSEALGLVFICAGLSIWLEVSFLLAGMVAGAIVVNLAKHHTRAFHEIEHIEWPFMVLFFLLAGASLHFESLTEIGFLGAAYIGLRCAGRILGGWLGGSAARSPAVHRRWIGLALFPQAGVALGMALVAGGHFPDQRDILLTVTIGTTVVFELVGPLLTQIALKKAREGEQAIVKRGMKEP